MTEQNQAPVSQYEYVRTEDGSPTVYMRAGVGCANESGEHMHHSGGALTESLYIYLSAVQRTLELGLPPKVVSVGLGLGYNEAITVAYVLSAGRLAELDLISFEIDPIIRNEYLAWLQRPSGPATTGFFLQESAVTFHWDDIFTDVLIRVAEHFSLSAETLKADLRSLLQCGRFRLFGALEKRPELQTKYTCILFDAFSKKATPDLWQEPFLIDLFRDLCAPSCVVATYAATGSLNRALRQSGFLLLRRSGFQGKRESTWAERKT